MQILILSRSENVHADAVEEYCKKYARVDRINFDFDTYSQERLPSILFGENKVIRFLAPRAVFVHHPRISYKNEWFTDEIERKLFVASWDSVKEWMESQFSNALWVNRPSLNNQSRNVLRQLKIARELKLKVPETIFTNKLDELRRFADLNTVIIKQGNLGVHLEKKRILTSLIDVHKIDQKTLCGCPCLFQKYITKKFELRVHVIGNNVLSCKINSQVSEKTRIDWRNYDLENTPHESHTLNSVMNKQCIELVKRLGLVFGILDIIVTPQGDYVFLECNAQGHWTWIEQLTKLPITKTLCDYFLLSGLE